MKLSLHDKLFKLYNGEGPVHITSMEAGWLLSLMDELPDIRNRISDKSVRADLRTLMQNCPSK